MGTRADFYVGRGETAEWLGSIAWDGYPSGITNDKGDPVIFDATTERQFRQAVFDWLTAREDATLPRAGWPWPWPDSRTTDYAYAFDNGKVWACCFGYEWFDPQQDEPEGDEDRQQTAIFPQMKTDRAKPPGATGSGIMLIGGGEILSG